MNETVDPREVRRAAEAERVNAEAAAASAQAWSHWAEDIGERFAVVEAQLLALIGDPTGKRAIDCEPALYAVVDGAIRAERSARAESFAKITNALTARLEAEIAVLDERLSEKLDSKVFDLSSIRQFRTKIAKLATDLQNDVVENMKIADARIEALADQIAALNKKRDVHALAARLAVLERGLPKPAVTIKSWRLDVEGYQAIPTMSDGKEAAPLDLHPLFQRYTDEMEDTRR